MLVEVGATNRTRLGDYRVAAQRDGAAAILKVHRSNFRIEGFTEEASLTELSELARELGVPLVHDLGSGLLLDPHSSSRHGIRTTSYLSPSSLDSSEYSSE